MFTISMLHRSGLLALPRVARLAAAAGLLALLPACSKDEEKGPPAAGPGPARISVPQAALSPEGIQYDEITERFVVSSRTQGRVGTVRDDSTYTVLADEPRLISTIGLNLDAPNTSAVAENHRCQRRSKGKTRAG